jgi:serine/threonine protein kinase
MIKSNEIMNFLNKNILSEIDIPSFPEFKNNGEIGWRDRYIIQKNMDDKDIILGKGHLSIIYKALDVNNNKYVSMKKINISSSVDELYIYLLLNEIKFLKSISGTNSYILKYHDSFISTFNNQSDKSDKLCVILVTEFVEGIDFLTYLENLTQSLDVKSILTIIKQLFIGINYIHSMGYAHRDIKPDNIMINPETLDIKIIDFEFVSNICEDNPGTHGYEPPETHNSSINGDRLKLAQAQDIWGLGITIYYLINIKFPYMLRDNQNNLIDPYNNRKRFNYMRKSNYQSKESSITDSELIKNINSIVDSMLIINWEQRAKIIDLLSYINKL